MKIILVYGGKSEEHDISILSAFSLLKAIYFDYYSVQLIFINKEGIWVKGPEISSPPMNKEELVLSYKGYENGHGLSGEIIQPCNIKEKNAVIFPILHGPNGEDGTIQGLFEIMNMPYVGAGVLASACGMDKIMTKNILQQSGIPQLPFSAINKSQWQEDPEQICDYCEGSLVYPMYVKPANMGSSVGISRARNREELTAGISEAMKFDRRVVVEQGIDAREIEIAVLGNDDVRTTVAGEIVKTVDFYDYEAKYIDNEVTMQIPADIPQEVHDKARMYAEKAYVMLDGCGLSRCDFFLTSNDELFLNEINTMPGFTPFSMYPLLWKEMGVSYGDLIEELIQLALKRHKEKQ